MHNATVDADGVMMASIQALYRQNQESARKVERLQARVTHQQAQLDQVRRALRRKRVARR